MVIMMTIKYGLQFFFELTDNDGQNFLAGIVHLKNQEVDLLQLFPYVKMPFFNFSVIG
jgi:hypothetical protein